MAITTPYSLELTADQSMHEAVADIDSDVTANKMKIFLGSAVTAANRVSILGTLQSCFNELMVQAGRGADTSTNTKTARANFIGGTSGTVTVEAVTSNITTSDVAIVVSGTFGSERNQTLAYREAFRKLTDRLQEVSNSN